MRVQPLADLPAIAGLPGDTVTTLRVVDVSIGGVGVWVQRGTLDWEVGQQRDLELTLGRAHHTVRVSVRHLSPDRTVVGLRFEDLADDARSAIHGYVSELTERGA